MNTTRLASSAPAAIDTRLVEVQTEADALRRRLAVLAAEEAEIGAEFTRRGGWTRSYLVTGGHLHTSTACSTCYPTTSFFFIPALSGATQDEIVAEAGERACTVCFPDAPVATLRKPSALRTPAEKVSDEERAAKAEKRTAAAAQAIIVEGLEEYRGRAHTFKSERALSNFVASQASSIAAWGEGHPTAPVWHRDLTTAAEALAAYRSALVDSYIDPREIALDARKKAEKRVAAERRRG